MSIKRTSKSTGAAARKQATSPAMRHVEVTAPQRMVAGQLYSGWPCKNKACGLVIAIALPPAGSKPASEADDQLVVIKCPHCADENLYRWSARAEHAYAVKGTSP